LSSPEIVAAVPQKDLSIPRGSARTIRIEVTIDLGDGNGPQLYDLRTTGTQLVFTAKARMQGDPVFQKSYQATATAPLPGIAVGGISLNTGLSTPASTGGSVAEIALVPADTEDAESLLAYDLWLADIAGREVPILTGRLKLTSTVFRP
jgi:hypothetical protein